MNNTRLPSELIQLPASLAVVMSASTLLNERPGTGAGKTRTGVCAHNMLNVLGPIVNMNQGGPIRPLNEHKNPHFDDE